MPVGITGLEKGKTHPDSPWDHALASAGDSNAWHAAQTLANESWPHLCAMEKVYHSHLTG